VSYLCYFGLFAYSGIHRDLLPVNKKIDYPHIYSSVYMWIVDLFIDREQVPVNGRK